MDRALKHATRSINRSINQSVHSGGCSSLCSSSESVDSDVKTNNRKVSEHLPCGNKSSFRLLAMCISNQEDLESRDAQTSHVLHH